MVTDHKTCLYTDDVLVTLTNPNASLPTLLSLLKEFGSYAGCKLNLHKIQTFTFNYEPQENIRNLDLKT